MKAIIFLSLIFLLISQSGCKDGVNFIVTNLRDTTIRNIQIGNNP